MFSLPTARGSGVARNLVDSRPDVREELLQGLVLLAVVQRALLHQRLARSWPPVGAARVACRAREGVADAVGPHAARAAERLRHVLGADEVAGAPLHVGVLH